MGLRQKKSLPSVVRWPLFRSGRCGELSISVWIGVRSGRKIPRIDCRHGGTRKGEDWTSSAGRGQKGSNARLVGIGFSYKQTHVPDLFCAVYACSVAATAG